LEGEESECEDEAAINRILDLLLLEKEESEHAPASLQVTAQAEPLTLLAVFKLLYGMLVWLQLCNPQGVSLFSFVRLPPRVRRPFAGAPVHDMSLTHGERLRAVGCGLKGKLVRLLSLSKGRHFEAQVNGRAHHQMMHNMALRLASKCMAAVRDKAAKEAEELCASGQCAAAVGPLQLAVYLGDMPSRALEAWLLIRGREGVEKDASRGFKLAEEGARLGCRHCQGVVAYCFCFGFGCEGDEAQSLPLALESSGRGSRYGQLTLGVLHYWKEEYAQAVAFYRLAAAQGLDEAQYQLGIMYYNGFGVVLDYAEALRWHQIAAAQGYPLAFFSVAVNHEGNDVDNVGDATVEAIRWYRRAQAAGDSFAAEELQRLTKKLLRKYYNVW
jgi:TPR repeat protein